ncbi:hypothetical protein MRB53_037273 [Persea americana]|nr:hypothetical protein MRB53_037273 [Persea americana]
MDSNWIGEQGERADQLKSELEHITKGQEILNSQFPPPGLPICAYRVVDNFNMGCHYCCLHLRSSSSRYRSFETISTWYNSERTHHLPQRALSCHSTDIHAQRMGQSQISIDLDGAIWHTKFDDGKQESQEP